MHEFPSFSEVTQHLVAITTFGSYNKALQKKIEGKKKK
jgi:hypothetical protein